MKRLTALTFATLAVAATLVPAAPAAAAVTCGNYTEAGDSGQYHRRFYYGNCTAQGVLANVYKQAYGLPSTFERQVCVPAQQAVKVGESTNYVTLRYFVRDTAGAC
ncbi:hypothetical protein GCM10009557_51260 [Virgisporangium ochraceum]|uniref:Secreted protein n=1 Tax=Virgisporangium ochraceum TaxID=65505 RepID=A0A8J4EEZ7_9ACTN|nr:hypothetical protein [Virgisporangium ochraceum]GIJ72236.1 hypothetical protein Voc01_071530 [Virgisporangium ochraceum]